MSYTSLDDMTAELTSGKGWRADYNKQSAATAVWRTGSWNDLSVLAGYPVANTWPGTTLVAQTPTDKNGGAALGASWGIYHGGNVSVDTKHIINMGAFSSVATSVPGLFMLVDVVMYYPLISNLSTLQQTLINSNTFSATSSSGLLATHANDFGTANHYTTVKFTNSGGTLPTGLNSTDIFYMVRQTSTTSKFATSHANALAGTFVAYTDAGSGTHTLTVTPTRYADGAGLRMYLTEQARGGSNSSGTPVMDQTAVSGTLYTNQAGTTGRTFGAPVSFVAGAANTPLVSTIPHSGTAANSHGPFLPLGGGDYGIQRLQAYKLTTAYGGASTEQVSAVICRPLATIPVVTAGAAGERNLVFQLPSLPRVYDDACLNLLYFNGNSGGLAVSSPLMAYMDFGWG